MTLTAHTLPQIQTEGSESHRFRWLLALLLALACAIVTSLCLGSRDLPLSAVWAVLTGGGDVESRAIVFDQRIPRTVIAAVGGAALAVAGVLMQGHTRNSLADPGLLGVTAGASLFVVVAIAYFGASTPAGYLWFAVAGAFFASVIVTTMGRLAGGRRDSSPATLVLAGAAVSALLAAVGGIILLRSPVALDSFRFWTVGSLSGVRDLAPLTPAFVLVAVGLVIAVGHSSTLDALALGDDTARALGRRLAPARLTGLLAVTLLVAGAVALCGSLGFIGLIGPHLVRSLIGPGHRWLIPYSILAGAVLVLVADVFGRVIVRPAEIPVGVVLAVFGAPVFLAMVSRLWRAR